MDDHKAKIAKAAAILGKYKAGENLTYLVDSPYLEAYDYVEGVRWDSSYSPKTIPSADVAVRIEYKGQVFELLATNIERGYDSDFSLSDFTLMVDGTTVLVTRLSTQHGEFTKRRKVLMGHWLKQVRLDQWMEDIQGIASGLRSTRQTRRQRIKEKHLAEKAAAIDLGKYDI